MTPLTSVFCLVFLCLVETGETEHSEQLPTVQQEQRFLSANVGESVTLRCFYSSDSSKYFWYKQTLGQQPRLFSKSYKYNKNSTFHAEFKNNPRFTLETTDEGNHLKISNVQTSDTGTYYCAKSVSFVFEFGEGTTVSVKSPSLNVGVSVRQSESEDVQPEGSASLDCTVQTGTCDEELGVYWFKNMEDVLYTHGKNLQCETESGAQTRTCVHTLTVKGLDRAHAGKYYCAVALCGHVIFGNGTMLEFQGQEESLSVVYFLIGALTITIIMIVVLAFQLCKIIKRNKSRSTAKSQTRVSAPPVTTTEGCQDAASLHYAALNVNPPKGSRKQTRDTSSECVYSSVKH